MRISNSDDERIFQVKKKIRYYFKRRKFEELVEETESYKFYYWSNLWDKKIMFRFACNLQKNRPNEVS